MGRLKMRVEQSSLTRKFPCRDSYRRGWPDLEESGVRPRHLNILRGAGPGALALSFGFGLGGGGGAWGILISA